MLWAANQRDRRPYGFGRRLSGIAIASTISVLVVALFVVILQAGDNNQRGVQPDIFHLLRMSTLQAGLTTILSLIAGTALAWSLNRLKFRGRNLIASLFASAIVTPGLVIAFGLIAVWGRSGWVSDALSVFGIEWSHSLFGLHGIIFAHTILDAAFAVRIILNRLDALPAQKLKIAQSLNLSALRRFITLDWPAIVSTLPGLGAVIFLLAFTSFPIVLMLGGGPANQTLEVAIYAAVRLSFDLNLAVQLALVQLIFCALIIGPALIFSPSFATTGTRQTHHWADSQRATGIQIAILIIGLTCFALPLMATLAKGFGSGLGPLLIKDTFWRATFTSLSLGSLSALTTIGLSLGLVMGRNSFSKSLWRTAIAAPTFAYLIIPAVVMSLAFFLFVRNLGIAPSKAAFVVIILGNTLLALPFAVATLSPALDAIDRRYARLAQSLNLSGWQRWRYAEWPLLRAECGIVFALGFCFSLGDLGIISMFGTDQFTTLPWMMFRAAGAYRNNDAAAIAAILLTISIAVFFLAPALTNRLNRQSHV